MSSYYLTKKALKQKNGQCFNCDNKLSVNSKFYCDAHLERHRSKEKRRRLRIIPIKIANNICRRCEDNALEGKAFCTIHLEYFRERNHLESTKQRRKAWVLNNSEHVIEYRKNYNSINQIEIKAKHSEYYQKNKEKIDLKSRNWAKRNPEATRKIVSNWGKNNKGKINAKTNRRRAAKLKATPKWLTEEHKAQILHIYQNTPAGHHVDHIIPLKSDIVCGLHVPWNLQYLPGGENCRKGNRLK